MKTTAVLIAALLSTPLIAQDAAVAPTTTPAPAVEMTEQAQQHLQLTRNILEVLRELTGTLDSVKDRNTADAAAVKVQEIATRMQELQMQADSYPALSKEQEKLVKSAINEQEVQETVHNFLVSIVQIAQANCYESLPMNQALGRVLSKATKASAGATN